MHFYHLIFVILVAFRINRHIFEVSKIYENIFDASTLLLKCRVHFWMRRRHFGRVVDILDASAKHPIIFQCYFRRVLHIFDASKKTLNYSSIFPRRVKMYRTRRRNMLLYFNVILDSSCKFSTCRKLHL